jgi:uncharacterized protein (TIGR02246 family)
MKSTQSTPLGALITAAFIGIGCASAPRPAGPAAPIQPAAFDPLFAEFDSAWNAHDAARLAELFVVDGNCVTPGGRRAVGRAALTEMFAAPGPTKSTTSISHADSARPVGPDLAFVTGSQTLSGPGVEQIGSSRGGMVGLAREIDHKWRFVEVHAFALSEHGARGPGE